MRAKEVAATAFSARNMTCFLDIPTPKRGCSIVISGLPWAWRAMCRKVKRSLSGCLSCSTVSFRSANLC